MAIQFNLGFEPCYLAADMIMTNLIIHHICIITVKKLFNTFPARYLYSIHVPSHNKNMRTLCLFYLITQAFQIGNDTKIATFEDDTARLFLLFVTI